jgi:hypothetical protein
MFLIDRDYLTKVLSQMKIQHVDITIKIREINTVIHNCSEYVLLEIYISEFKEIAKLTRQAHVVDNLRAKFLMSMNILEFEKVIIDISRRKLIFSLCENLKVNMRITSKNESRMNKVILVERLVIISSKSVVSIFIKMKESFSDRDYLFQSISRELNLESIDEIMIHIMTINLAAVQVCNVTNKSVIISRRARLKRLIDYEKHECYVTDAKEAFLAAKSI